VLHRQARDHSARKWRSGVLSGEKGVAYPEHPVLHAEDEHGHQRRLLVARRQRRQREAGRLLFAAQGVCAGLAAACRAAGQVQRPLNLTDAQRSPKYPKINSTMTTAPTSQMSLFTIAFPDLR